MSDKGGPASGVPGTSQELADSGGVPDAVDATPAKGPQDVDVFVYVDDLHRGGQALYDVGMGLADGLAPILARVASLDAANPAGNDETGMTFRRGYDRVLDDKGTETSAAAGISDGLRVLGQGYAGMGVIAQTYAKACADTDDENASRTSKFIGVWGAPK